MHDLDAAATEDKSYIVNFLSFVVALLDLYVEVSAVYLCEIY